MQNQHLWKITGLSTYPQLDGKTDVVALVDYEITCTDGVKEVKYSNSENLVLDANSSFIPFNSLIEPTIIKWVQDKMGEEKINLIYGMLAKSIAIAHQQDKKPVSKKLPWATQ